MEAVEALGRLGVAGDLRGRFRQGHAVVGVRGARLGTAREALGDRPIELTMGHVEVDPHGPPRRLGLELRAFTLRASRAVP